MEQNERLSRRSFNNAKYVHILVIIVIIPSKFVRKYLCLEALVFLLNYISTDGLNASEGLGEIL